MLEACPVLLLGPADTIQGVIFRLWMAEGTGTVCGWLQQMQRGSWSGSHAAKGHPGASHSRLRPPPGSGTFWQPPTQGSGLCGHRTALSHSPQRCAMLRRLLQAGTARGLTSHAVVSLRDHLIAR